MLHTGWQKWNSTFFKIFLRGVSSSANVKGLSWANRVKETAGAICLVSLPKDGEAGGTGGAGGLFSCITFKASAKLCVSRIHMKTPLVVLTMAMHGLIWLSKGDARDLKSLLLGCKTLRWPPGGMHVKSLDWFTPLRGFESVPGESCVRGWGVSHLWYQGS